MKTKLPLLLLAAAALALPASLQAQSSDIPKVLREMYRVERYVEPMFPTSFFNKNISEGYAQIQLLVGADGTLLETYCSAFSHPEFAQSAERAVASWQFRPAADPAELPQRFNIRIDFRREGMLIVQGDPQEIIKSFLGQKDDREVALCKLRDLDTTPEVVNLVVPVYPTGLDKKRAEGHAAVSFYIDENGNVHVVSNAGASQPEFATAAVEAVKKWTFTPPLRKGQPTRVFAVQEFTFSPTKGVAEGKATP